MLHNMKKKKKILKSFCFKCFLSASQKVPLFFGLLSGIQVLHNALTALPVEQRLALNSEHHKLYTRSDVRFDIRSSMLEFLKQVRSCKTFNSLSAFYTFSMWFYKLFTIISIRYLLNITRAKSRIFSCAAGLSDRRRYSKTSYFIYWWIGMNLCAEL